MAEAIVLGIIQGLTEFLPVSSSGHLVLGKAALGVELGDIAFEVFVHFGTLISTVVYFRVDIYRLIASFLGALARIGSFPARLKNDDSLRLALFIVWGSIPAGAIGLAFGERLESLFSKPALISAMLIITGFALLATRFVRRGNRELGLASSFLVGIAQAIAIVPGISRSGSTVSAGLFLGLDGRLAVRYSFLLSLPAVLGATGLKSRELFAANPSSAEALPLILGTAAAFLSGLLAIKLVFGAVSGGKFSTFSFYCFALGVAGLIYFWA